MPQPAPGRIVQLNTSPGGVPKLPVEQAVVGTLGLDGDRHRSAGHGGPERAVCLYSLEVIQRLQAEGHPIAPGTAGENVTVAGLDWHLVVPGARLRLGSDVLLEVTRYTTPCLNIAASFTNGQFARILQEDHPGESRVYTRVLHGGELSPSDSVEVLAAAPPAME
ncbi:MAG: MOSC domain-containing protein [Chloroflexota bacterium]